LNELILIKNIKVKKDIEKKLSLFIGTYPLEILVEAIKLVRSVYNYTFIVSGKKSTSCFKTSTINMAINYLEDPYSYYANNIKTLLDKVKILYSIFFLLKFL